MVNFFEKLKRRGEIKFEEKKNEEKVKAKTKKSENLSEKKWLESEGELAIDMYETDSELVIQSAIAGVKPEELNIELEGDILIIEGERKKPTKEEGKYLIQECYWGKFSRKVVLPTEINPEKVEAEFKNGLLTIRLSKILKEKKKKILIRS